MKNLINYLVAMIGIIMALSMISRLEERCVSAEKARDAYRPIVSQYIDSQSGAEDAPPQPSLNFDEQMNLRMLDVNYSNTVITPTTAKWLTIAGFILFASSLNWGYRMEEKIQKAEQVSRGNS